MHPVLRQMRPTQPTLPPPTSAQAAVALSGAGGGDPDEEAMLDLEEGEGLARLGAPSPEHHPRVQLKRDARQAYVPPQNLFRDRSGQEPEEMRDRRFHAGKELRAGFNSQRVLRAEDFEPDKRSGVSPARAHVSAADLVTAYEQTVNEERNFQKTFNNHVRTLVAREG